VCLAEQNLAGTAEQHFTLQPLWPSSTRAGRDFTVTALPAAAIDKKPELFAGENGLERAHLRRLHPLRLLRAKR